MSSMTYLKNVWYFAGWKDELDEKPLMGRTIIEEPVLLFKNEQGFVSAIGDRCPHRFAPLHDGKLKGDVVECPYHGLQFDRTGHCVHNPHGDGKIPQAAQVKSYPLVERDFALWIWMGDPTKADPRRIPDYSFLGKVEPATRMTQTMYVKCNYELLTDNILDLTHADFIHEGVLGTGALTLKSTPRVWEEGDAIIIEWFVEKDLIMPGINEAMPDPHAPLDSWISVRWEAPASMLLETGVTLTGRPREEGIKSLNLHIMTPENAHTTHYFNAHTREYMPSAEFSVVMKEILRVAFMDQDKPMLEAQQKMMGTPDLWALKPVLLPGDVGAVRVRRALERMIAQEQKVPVPA